ncbi:MAG: polyprenol monophosphomannose synthase [Nitrospirae bacterium]|nr:polyprenol monophosphomannose synthase [Nitrospirota bacterium]
MKKTLVIIPTFNERETLPKVIGSILKREGFDVLVVDDGSPDGTALLVKEMMSEGGRISLIERPGKLGLGTAYVEGFKWGLERNYDYLVEMDADQSHDPDDLPLIIKQMDKGPGLVIGSRYLNGTISVVGWDFRRLLMSKFGNFYASRTLGLLFTDLTGGYRCFSREALMSIGIDKLRSNGYAFQIETAYRVATAGIPVGEVPIIFRERASGESKMSKKIIREAVILPWKLRLGRLFDARNSGASRDIPYHFRTITGFLMTFAGITGGLRLGWWLSTERNIIDILHEFKLGLPAWAWVSMKIGLSAFFAALFLSLVFTAVIAVFAGGGQRGKKE